MAAANLRQRILLQYYVCANGLYQGVFRSGRPDGLPGAADVVGRQIVLITLSPGLRVATNTCSIYATYFQYFTGEEILHHALRHKSSGLGHWRRQAADIAAAQLDLACAAISRP